MRNPRINAKRLAVCGMLTAAAFVLSYVESLLPFSIGGAGVKIGLANIVSLSALYTLGAGYALFVLLARIFLSALTFGGMSALLYSFVGGMLSFFVMWLLKKCKLFTCVGVGIAGGVTHNIGQLIVASAMLSQALVAYLPVLLFFGALAGTVVGIVAALINKRIRRYVHRGIDSET